MEILAAALADKAFEFSMDRRRDGPFALLAKENDILWSHGGRLDDITVMCVRVALAKQGEE
jgi:protein phosphatase PTC7